MKFLTTLFLVLTLTLGFSQDPPEQLTFFFGEVTLISKSGDTLSVPLQVTGQMYTVTPQGDTLSFITLDENSTAPDAVWPASKLSQEFEKVNMSLDQLDDRLFLFSEGVTAEIGYLKERVIALEENTPIIDTVVVIDSPIVDCNDPLNELRFDLINAETSETIRALTGVDTIIKSEGPFSIAVTSCDEAGIKRVTFLQNGVILKTESVAPFAINGDSGGVYKPWDPVVRTFELSAIVERKDGGENEILLSTITIQD